MNNLIGIGASGLVGSRVNELLGERIAIHSLSRQTGIDITDPATISFSTFTDADTVILFAAKADVDQCELDKQLGEAGETWRINVEGTRNVVEACKRDGKKLVYISTDFVFSGDDTPEGGYIEESTPHPINWYGETKFQAEEIVKSSGIEYLIIRPAYPYRAQFEQKKDFVRAILGRLSQGQPITAITDHYYNPTFIDDIAEALYVLLEKKEQGIFHVVGAQTLTPYDAAHEIAKVFGCDPGLIGKTTRDEYFKGKARRPYNLMMNHAKITNVGVRMRSFTDGLLAMKEQL